MRFLIFDWRLADNSTEHRPPPSERSALLAATLVSVSMYLHVSYPYKAPAAKETKAEAKGKVKGKGKGKAEHRKQE